MPLAPSASSTPMGSPAAAAERGHEEHVEAAPAEHPAAPLEAASPEAAAAGEPIGAEEAEGAGGTPVPPIRRRAENGVEKKPD